MKKTDLLQVISSPTLAKLSKGEVVKTDIIEKICLFLKCQPSDIMEIVEIDENGNILRKNTLDHYGYKSREEIYLHSENEDKLIDVGYWE